MASKVAEKALFCGHRWCMTRSIANRGLSAKGVFKMKEIRLPYEGP
jgi:hypothetical protein